MGVLAGVHPGGGSIFGFGGSRGGGISSFYPVIAAGIIIISRYRALDEAEMDCCKTEETIRGLSMSGTPLIRLADVSKVYHLESGDFTALNHITLDINEGEFVALMGPSGSGKSTMMNQLGILDVPTTGEIFYRREECCQNDKP